MKFVSELSKESLICTELKVKDYKELLKCAFGDEPNKIIFVETICEILSKISNKEPEYFKNLNVIDLFCLLLDVRINSQGDVCKVVITKEEKQMNLELRLDYIRDDMKASFGSLSSSIIKQNNIDILFECPSIERLMQEADEEYLYFIKGATIKNPSERFIETKTNEEASVLFERLAPKVSLQIIEKFEQFVKHATSINFLSRYGISNQKLSFLPSLDSLIWFTKLMFNESLETFYDNMFYLSHSAHMSSEYIENCIVGEYTYFVNCLQRTLAVNSPNPTPDDEFISDEEAGLSEEQI